MFVTYVESADFDRFPAHSKNLTPIDRLRIRPANKLG